MYNGQESKEYKRAKLMSKESTTP